MQRLSVKVAIETYASYPRANICNRFLVAFDSMTASLLQSKDCPLMKNLMRHRGLLGTVEYNDARQILTGRLLNVRRAPAYEAASVSDLHAAFQATVDDYLQRYNPPEHLSGSFNVRIGGELHRMAVIEARSRKISLNRLIKQAVAVYLGHDRE